MESKGFLKPYICTQCGGKVNRTTLVCEMCGTHFKDESQGEAYRLIVTRPGVVTLGKRIYVDTEVMSQSPEVFSEFAIKQLAREFVECIVPYMDIKAENRPEHHQSVLTANLRVLQPEYRF